MLRPLLFLSVNYHRAALRVLISAFYLIINARPVSGFWATSEPADACLPLS